MTRILIVPSLSQEILKRLGKAEAKKIAALMQTIEQQPRKGKLLTTIDGILIKELKYKKYRFYFLVDGEQLRFIDKESLVELLIRFVRMSDKKKQQATIEEIKRVLRAIGPEGFS